MAGSLQTRVAHFQAILQEYEISSKIKVFTAAARTAQQAADAIGCEVGEIVKSLVFRGTITQRAVLVLTSGANHVDEQRLSKHIQEPVAKADAGFVRNMTGYTIGGVPPFGHLQPLSTFIDVDLFRYQVIWAAAGTPNTVFPLSCVQLRDATKAQVIRVCDTMESRD
jgi:prolyl-tRNA editing enzyme YbaK/EbsC (Cys-tRNA(Pro) deacylase)